MNTNHDSRRANPAKAARALEILNAPPTVEALTERLSAAGGAKFADLAPAIFARRAEIGSFRDLDELDGIAGLDGPGTVALVDGLNPPSYEFESETLESVRWTHGSSLVIEKPEAFGSITRRKQGIRIESARWRRSQDDPYIPGISWAHMAIAAPTFDAGKEFYVKSVLLNLSSSNPPFDVRGGPIATPVSIEVWDGHDRIAEERMPYLSSSENRYLRVPVESGSRLRWGLSVSLEIIVMSVPDESDRHWYLDIGAVGVELVTRTNLVFTPT